MSDEPGLSEEQKRYLEGFMSGIAARHGSVVPASSPAGPPDIHRAAQDRFLAQGKTLVPEELAKRQGHPLDMWDEIAANVAAGRFPKGIDVFRHKFFGLFYAAPAQDAFMCRLRMPNGILNAHQLRGIADIAEHRRRRLRRCHDARQSADPRDRRGRCLGGADRRCRIWASPRAAPAPTISATSPAAPRPGSIRRSSSTPGPWRARSIITSSITASFTACRASSTSPSTAAARSACSRTPMTSASPPSGSTTAPESHRASISACSWAASPATAISPAIAGVLLDAGAMRAHGGRGGARLHRVGRPHRPQARAAQICARCLGYREIHGRGREGIAVQALRACRFRPARRAGRC